MVKVLFLDAVGTLFDVRGSVGEMYSQFIKGFGVEASAENLNQAFLKSFISASPMAFPGVDREQIPEYEFEWWYQLAVQTFQKAGVFEQFADFPSFFQELYAYFAAAEPWFVYPEVAPALARWRSRGIELGIISNFDSRIYPVLKALNLAEFFTSVTISTEVGAAKPEPQIFLTAGQKYPHRPAEVLHVGDSLKADYHGALAAGFKAVWLNREGPGNKQPLPLDIIQCGNLDFLDSHL